MTTVQKKENRQSPSSLYVNAVGVAKILGYEKSWFYETLDDLEAQGFPKKDPLLKKWSRTAIIEWDLHRHGSRVLASNNDDADEDPFYLAAGTFNA